MKQDDKKDFANLMLGISEIYTKEVSKFGMQMWFDDLAAYSFEQVKAAFAAHRQDRKNGEFMPKPSDIIRQIEGAPDEVAVRAWSKVVNAIGYAGSYNSVCFDDRVIHAVINEMGGWMKVCSMETDELPFKAKEFERLYLSKTSNRGGQALGFAPSHLPGQIELQNGRVGYGQKAEMIFIGDQSKAKTLYLESNPAPTSQQLTVGMKTVEQTVKRLGQKFNAG